MVAVMPAVASAPAATGKAPTSVADRRALLTHKFQPLMQMAALEQSLTDTLSEEISKMAKKLAVDKSTSGKDKAPRRSLLSSQEPVLLGNPTLKMDKNQKRKQPQHFGPTTKASKRGARYSMRERKQTEKAAKRGLFGA